MTAGTYDEVLADPRVDAVYVSTVHTGHARLVLAALEAGKAVLCEKPLAVNHGTAMALTDAARRSGLPLVEAFMYRFHPQTAALLDLVRDGVIGDVTHVDASFAFRTGERTGRLFDVDTAGGGILDVGGYPVTMAAAIVQAATGVAVAEPVDLTATGTLGPTGVDEWTVAQLAYKGGITATVRTGVFVQDDNAVSVYGSRGRIALTDPWTLGDDPTIEIHTVDEPPRSLSFAGEHPYAREADATTDALRAGGVEAAQMTIDETLATARTLDRWRAAIGLRYPFEAETADIPTVSGRPLTVQDGNPMRFGEVPGVGKRMSRLVMGVDNQPDLAHASAIFDLFVEQGGNVFDTGYIYGGGVLEGRLGRWIQNRGIREDVVVITKGAHTPYCDPESITRQLLESLERQGTDYADIYMMHRDNPDIPVGSSSTCSTSTAEPGASACTAARTGPPHGSTRRTPTHGPTASTGSRCSATTSVSPRRTTCRGTAANTRPMRHRRPGSRNARSRCCRGRRRPAGSSPAARRPRTPATPNSSAATTRTTTSSGSGVRANSASSSASPRRRSRWRTCSTSRSRRSRSSDPVRSRRPGRP